MTIKNAEAYVRNLWDWAILDGCFGESKIAPTDIDGLVEHNGQFLLIETKEPGKPIPLGQRIMFDRLCEKPGFNVLVVWGTPGSPEELMFWGRNKYRADLAALRKAITRWYEFTEDN